MTTPVTKLVNAQMNLKCANCGEGHMAGSNDCEIEIKERVIKKMQTDRKVGRRVAKIKPSLIPYTFQMQNGSRKFHPWAIEKSFTQQIRSKPATIRSNNESEFVIEMSNEKKAKFFQLLNHYVIHNTKKGSKLKYSLVTKSTKAMA